MGNENENTIQMFKNEKKNNTGADDLIKKEM